MKLADAMKIIAKKKEQRAESSVVETVDTRLPREHQQGKHRGIIHVMGIKADSDEYEEMSTKLDRLSRTNPTLYQKIVSLD